jgi:hypothetical protein
MSEEQGKYIAKSKQQASGTRDDYIKCFNTLHGKKVLEHLFQTYCINTFDPDPCTMAAKAGQHGLVMLIMVMSGYLEETNFAKTMEVLCRKKK